MWDYCVSDLHLSRSYSLSNNLTLHVNSSKFKCRSDRPSITVNLTVFYRLSIVGNDNRFLFFEDLGNFGVLISSVAFYLWPPVNVHDIFASLFLYHIILYYLWPPVNVNAIFASLFLYHIILYYLWPPVNVHDIFGSLFLYHIILYYICNKQIFFAKISKIRPK